MTPDERRELAAGVALGGATPEERLHLEAAVADDPALARDLAAYRATVSALEAGVAREAPSADLFGRILVALDEPDAAPASAPAPVAPVAPVERSRWSGLRWPRVPRVALGAAVAAAAVLVVGVVLVSRDDVEPDAVAAIAGTNDFSAVSGTAELFPEDGSGDRLVLRLASVPPAPTGHHYEVWVLPEGSETMESVGRVAPSDGEAELEVEVPGSGPFAAVDVSVEPDDGDPGHSGVSLASGTFS
jgi:anti-sigma-K factor RskA